MDRSGADMEVSFSQYRKSNYVVSDTDSDSDAIDASEDSSGFLKANRKVEQVIIPDSDEDDCDDKIVLSRATRLSIFGNVHSDGEVEESDFIESENTEEDGSGSSNFKSATDQDLELENNENMSIIDANVSSSPKLKFKSNKILPLRESNQNDMSIVDDDDCSSPILKSDSHNRSSTPVKIKSENNKSMIDDISSSSKLKFNSHKRSPLRQSNQNDMSIIDDDDIQSPIFKSNFHNKSSSPEINENNMSVIDLSSDEETDKIPETRKSVPVAKELNFSDKTYPNSNVIYVSKVVYQNERKKLDELRQDLDKMQVLIKKIHRDALPDKGSKLEARLFEVKLAAKNQAEKLAKMIPETDDSEVQYIKNENVIKWDELEKGSNAVQPKMFGTQAMNTHLNQRAMTLKTLHSLHSSLDTRPTESTLEKQPRGLVTPLMPHQLHALAWLSWRESQKPRGGILADDMGLGKTLTMISLILHSKENNLEEPDESINEDDDDAWNSKKNGKLLIGGTLVVCPASLMKQWNGEVENHCKKHMIKTLVHHGAKRETKAQRLVNYDLVITTYNIVQRDLEKKGVLMRIRWTRIILDEAHIVRNHKSLTAQAMYGLVGYSRWCLTGTPVHNKDLDLFSLLKFLRCSPFDDIVLWKKWIDNKSLGGQERLAMVMKSLMLRRTKLQLQEQKLLCSLPSKTMHYIDITLTKEEMNVYQKVLILSKTLFAQFLKQRSEKNFSNMNANDQEQCYRLHKKMIALHGGKEVKSHEILVLLLRLRQICCHAGLIHAMLDDEISEQDLNRSAGNFSPEIDILSDISKLNLKDINTEGELDPNVNEPTSVADAIKKVMHPSNPVFDLKKQSAKIKSVLLCLHDQVLKTKGDKAIIVSQWTGVLDIIKDNLKIDGIKCSMLSGKVPVPARQDIVDGFNSPTSGVQVLLLSLCAGGVGLNLVGGNHLLLVDLHWNPQLESQAQDRIYRVGQTKPVHIYKFVCKETVESTIKSIQDKKLELAENVLTGAKMIHSSKLTMEDLKLMFNMT